MICPRRTEDGAGPGSPFWGPEKGNDPDRWHTDNTCTYCGSLNPDTLMERLEAGTVRVDPTDKGYKLYVNNEGGEAFKKSYRTGDDKSDANPYEKTDWVTKETAHTKFYFQHLSAEQRLRFIELLNESKVKLGEPGHFYVLPFFIGIKGYDFAAKRGPKPTVYCLRGDEQK